MAEGAVHGLSPDARRNIAYSSARQKRSTSIYDRSGAISDAMANEVLDLAKTLRNDVEAWLRKNHPDLMKRS